MFGFSITELLVLLWSYSDSWAIKPLIVNELEMQVQIQPRITYAFLLFLDFFLFVLECNAVMSNKIRLVCFQKWNYQVKYLGKELLFIFFFLFQKDKKSP